MPKDYSWNHSLGAWVKKKTTEDVNYDEFDVEAWGLLISYWRWYPDMFLDMLESENADYSLEFIQRVNLRIFARYEEAFITGSRATTKTYIAFLSEMLDGVLWPGTQSRYFGPSLKDTAEIGAATFAQIKKNYPGLAAHWLIDSATKDTFEIKTQYGSVISIAAMRGDNSHQVLAEECGKIEQPQFDHEKFRTVVLGAVRLQHMVQKQPDETHIDYKKHYITSASTQQNPAFEIRKQIMEDMDAGGSAFAIDYPWQIAVLSGIRNLAWAKGWKRKLTPEEWLREMESLYTGTSENPVIADSTLTECKSLLVAETHHCGDKDAIYIIGYDVSYRDGVRNAKCAIAALKCTAQNEYIKRDRYLKDLVYVNDFAPPKTYVEQARLLKKAWYQFCMEGGGETLIAVDANSIGDAVLEHLMSDLDDGLPILCCIDHQYSDKEQPGALPVIYPIRAVPGSGSLNDPDGEMLKYAELEFDHHNVRLLTTNINTGVDAFKKYFRLKDDSQDDDISIPYKKTKEMCGQIANLKKKSSGANWSETRISNRIQRDMWSATKYALRLAQIIESKNLSQNKRTNEWEKEYAEQDNPHESEVIVPVYTRGRAAIRR